MREIVCLRKIRPLTIEHQNNKLSLARILWPKLLVFKVNISEKLHLFVVNLCTILPIFF